MGGYWFLFRVAVSLPCKQQEAPCENNCSAPPQTNDNKFKIKGTYLRNMSEIVKPLYDYPISLSRGRIRLLSGPVSTPKGSTKAELLQTERQRLSRNLYPKKLLIFGPFIVLRNLKIVLGGGLEKWERTTLVK